VRHLCSERLISPKSVPYVAKIVAKPRFDGYMVRVTDGHSMKKWKFLAWILIVAACLYSNTAAFGQRKMIEIAEKAPDFTLPATIGGDFKLSDYLGKSNVVLFFYPKNNTAICTAEACSFRDNYEVFKTSGAEVVGISSDSAASHQSFASKLHLPYKLLSDVGGKVRKLYGVPATAKIIPGRVTFLIDKQGVVRHAFNSQMDAQKHVEETLKILKTLS